MNIGILGSINGRIDALKQLDFSGLDFIVLTGDFGDCTIAREIASKHFKHEKIQVTKKQEKEAFEQTRDSTYEVIKYLSTKAPLLFVYGNVENTPHLPGREETFAKEANLYNMFQEISKNIIPLNNRMRTIRKIRFAGIPYLTDTCWISEFNPQLTEEDRLRLQDDHEKLDKTTQHLKPADIVICHQEMYGILDTVNSSYVPKEWSGKHAGSKLIKTYVEKTKPSYVFSGHIHESHGSHILGPTVVYNLGLLGFKRISIQPHE